MEAIGTYDLGLDSEAFWGKTPRQFAALLGRRERQERAADRRAGEVVAILFNIHADRKKHPNGITWLDVFQEWKEPAPAQTEEQMFGTMMLWAQVTAAREA